jgi:hypothetical protein
MPLLMEPPDLAVLRARLDRAANEVASVVPVLDRAVGAYREATAAAGALPGDDHEFVEAFERFTTATGTGVLGEALLRLEILIGSGLWGP